MNETQTRLAAAYDEREMLTDQARFNHESNVAAEERRYEAELAQIQRVYEMRTEGLQ